MSLFSTLQIANNALSAQQLGLQVTGNNVANANTPGYIRERLTLAPATANRIGGLLVGLGVDVQGVVLQTDRFLEERLRISSADVANTEAQSTTYSELESLLGELSDNDLSTSLTRFFGSVNDVLNQPDNLSVRNLAIQQGATLSTDIRRLDKRIRDVRSDLDGRISGAVSRVNGLLRKIADLNLKIVSFEGGGSSKSDAVGLRDERSQTANELTRLIGCTTIEQPDGALAVFARGDYLVSNGTIRKIGARYDYDRGMARANLEFIDTQAPIAIDSGELAGQITGRDAILGGALDQLGNITAELIHEFNKVHASGQGLTGYSELTGEFPVSSTTLPLDQAGLPFPPENGTFQLLMYNKQTKQSTTTNINVRLNGMEDDNSLDDVAAALDAIDGLSAEVTPDRKLRIRSDSSNFTFGFANDTSGILASLGINTFFSGSTSSNIAINANLRNDPTKFAASSTGFGKDSKNAEVLAALLDFPLPHLTGESVASMYENFISETAQAAANTKAANQGFAAFNATLESQMLSISGVNLDEEAVRMIAYQRAYQAAARMIKAVDDLLGTLVNL